jgi:hypothetical protein
MRLKFSQTKYDATLLGLTIIAVWGSVLWLLTTLALGIGR